VVEAYPPQGALVPVEVALVPVEITDAPLAPDELGALVPAV